jgi:hypothetical protein
VDGVLVQEMVSGAEVFAGVNRDPDFGLVLAFGLGGVAIEVVRDFALRPLPLREGDAEAMLREIRGAPLLGPVRGRPAPDVASLVRCLEALADFAWADRAHVAEIDLNPIIVRGAAGAVRGAAGAVRGAAGAVRPAGCAVVDALIVPWRT